MKSQLFIPVFFISLFLSCDQNYKLTKIEGKRIEINDSLNSNSEIDAYILPYKKHVDSSLNSTISYSTEELNKNDGELNTAIGNLFADAVYSQTADLFKKQTGNNLDAVLLNHGGIRSILPKGNISPRTGYQLMPFENKVVVVGLKGEIVNEMIDYLVKSKRAHPISKQLRIQLNSEYELVSAQLNGKTIDKDSTYYIATNDYLFEGGDQMVFFKNNESVHETNYAIRAILIDYFKAKDTINPKRDDRFIRLID